MERMFLITASNRVRVESRILQVLDHHMVPVRSFSSMRIGDETRVTFMATLDEANAQRTCDLLRRLHDIQSIDSFAYQDGFCRTLALFRVLCDQGSRLPLLQVVSSMGAQVVAVRPEWIAFQMIASMQEIDTVRTRLLPYGEVEALSAASTAVRNHESQRAAEDRAAPISTAHEVRKLSTGQPSPSLYGASA